MLKKSLLSTKTGLVFGKAILPKKTMAPLRLITTSSETQSLIESAQLHAEQQKKEEFVRSFAQLLYQAFLKEERIGKKAKRCRKRFTQAVFRSHTPCRDILNEYKVQTTDGVHDSIIAETLEPLGRIVKMQGERPRAYYDLYPNEMLEHTDFKNIISDLQILLYNSQDVSPENLVKIVRALKMIKYKERSTFQLIANYVALVLSPLL